MIAKTIKGITIEIAGNTQPLNKALEDVNKKSKDLQSELRQVEKLLKLDPGNTDLLAQKQKLLAEAVENSASKLKILKGAQEQVQQQFQRGEIGEEQYRAFQREVAKAEQELSQFETQLKQTGAASRKLDIDIKGLGDKLKGIGTTMSAAVTAPIVGGFAAITQGTKELRGDLARLQANAQQAGQSMGVLDEAMAKLNAVTGETDSNVEGLSNLLATGFRDEQLTELLDSLYGAAIKFSDTLKFEGIADGLQETLATGAAIGPFAELLERSGVGLEDFNAGLQEAIKNGTEENYILEVLASTGLAETYEAYRKNNEEMIKAEEANFRMQQAMAKLGATLEPILTPIITKITEMVTKFNEMSPAGQKVVLVIAAIAAAIGPLLVIIGSIMTVLPVLGAAIGAISLPVVAVIAAIGLLIAAGVALYKNWDKVKAYTIQAWSSIKVGVLRIIASIMGAMETLYGWIPKIGGAVKASASAARQALEAETAKMEQAKDDWYRVNGGGTSNAGFRQLEEESKQSAASVEDLGTTLDTTIPSFGGLGAAASGAGTKAKEAAEKTKSAWETAAESLEIRLQLVKAQQENAALAAEKHGDEVKGLAEKITWLNRQHYLQQEIVEAVNTGYQESVEVKGADADETLKLAIRLEQEKKAQAEIEKQIRETTQAIKDQSQQLRDLAEEVTKVEEKYKKDLSTALDDYKRKVEETNRKVADEERKLTEQYQAEIDKRARSLSNFVGLFDQVTGRDVSGTDLLANLRGQVDAFENWSENIQALAARGVDEGLIEELREMGPKAGSEIAALNTLTDEQLGEYVALWRTKNEEARAEAVTQLQQQRVEMQTKLQEIRASANEQLELYRAEWEKKNAEIRKNADEELTRIQDKFQSIAEAGTTYGVSLVANFSAGMESQFDNLRRTLFELASIVDSYMPHSPAKRGPLSKIMEWGPALVGSFADGIKGSLPKLENAMAGMASLTPAAIGPSITNTSTSNNYGGNVFHINVGGGSSREQAENIMRELHRLGVRF